MHYLYGQIDSLIFILKTPEKPENKLRGIYPPL
jgi:hypothetical protein